MAEILSLRQENTKTFDLGGNKRQLVTSMGAIHYKDNYATDKDWLDIDLSWIDNKITKAPYELTLEGKKVTIRNKKTGEVSTIELLDIGGKSLPDKVWEKSKGLARAPGIVGFDNVVLDTDLEIVAENGAVRFTRVLKSNKAPKEAKFKVTGNFKVKAVDADGEDVLVESSLVDGVLTETLKPDNEIKYPVRIDPTWQVGASTDDCRRSPQDGDWGVDKTSIAAGAYGTVNYQYGGGMRFQAITIPQGSTITNAYLTLRAQTGTTYAGTAIATRISAEDVDDAPTFADNAAAFDARWANRDASAIVDWDAIPVWTADTDYNSPEIKTVIQARVDSPTWVSGNDIAIFWEDFEDRSTHSNSPRNMRAAHSWDGSTTYCPQLVITYTLPGWANIAKVGGIAIASMAKLHGIAVASIAKVGGVAV